MSTNNKISELIYSQAPFFVRNDHQTFLDFVAAYFEYMEQSANTLSEGKVVERTKNLLSYIDIDRTLDEFADKFYSEFLSLLPITALSDKTLVTKHVLDFYRSRGSEKSLKFLLRILFGKDAELYYPKRDVLRASDGKWFIQKSLRITGTQIDNVPTDLLTDLQNFTSRKITGETSHSTATIERVDRFYESGTLVDELILTNIRGSFFNEEQITTTYTGEDGVTHTITSNIFGGIINTITITNPGTNYLVGDPLIFESNDIGDGAAAIITSVSSGSVISAFPINGGAGFQANANFLISGGGGTGANAFVSVVDTSGNVHPNTYNIFISLISSEANTPIGNTVYSNLNFANANTALQNALQSFVYGPTGPIETITLRSGGSGYESSPTFDALANTRVKALGIIGRLEILTGGEDYAVNDRINFVSSSGFGANAIVSQVDGDGSIEEVKLVPNAGFVIGGFGYKQEELPTTTISSVSGSNGVVIATAILGDGEQIHLATSNVGSIEAIQITNRGHNYSIPPTINLKASGSGTAEAIATVITGTFTYPGRYLNDDGHLSAYNFLQDRDYYQNFSYVIKIQESLANYKKVIRDILHPAGLKFFGEYTLVDEDVTNAIISATPTEFVTTKYKYATYDLDVNADRLTIDLNNHGFSNNSNVYLEFDSDDVANGEYIISNVVNSSIFTITYDGTANSDGDVLVGTVV